MVADEIKQDRILCIGSCSIQAEQNLFDQAEDGLGSQDVTGFFRPLYLDCPVIRITIGHSWPSWTNRYTVSQKYTEIRYYYNDMIDW